MFHLDAFTIGEALFGLSILAGVAWESGWFSKPERVEEPQEPAPEPSPPVVNVVLDDIEIAQVSGNPHTEYLTVIYRNKTTGYHRICCIHIPRSFKDSHLSEIPVQEKLTELPEGWKEYLLSRPEARF